MVTEDWFLKANALEALINWGVSCSKSLAMILIVRAVCTFVDIPHKQRVESRSSDVCR